MLATLQEGLPEQARPLKAPPYTHDLDCLSLNIMNWSPRWMSAALQDGPAEHVPVLCARGRQDVSRASLPGSGPSV